MKKPKRPRDVNQLAKLIVDIATGQKVEPKAGHPSRGSLKGKLRAKNKTS